MNKISHFIIGVNLEIVSIGFSCTQNVSSQIETFLIFLIEMSFFSRRYGTETDTYCLQIKKMQ